MNKTTIKKLGIASFIVFAAMLAFAVSYIVFVINSIPVEKIVSASQELRTVGERPILEEGSLTKKDILINYHLFSGEPLSYNKWIERKVNSQEIEVLNQQVSLLKNIELAPLIKNECGLPYCFQHRISFKQMPSGLWKGLIGIEDYRFLNHSGIDPRSIARAIWHDLRTLSFKQGGSTLTQQLVKNLFYSNEKTIKRKIKELIVSIYIESKFEKEQILESYFNEVMWGALEGIKLKGIYAASLYYFSKKPEHLNDYEVSILIGLLKGPNFYSPIKHPDRLKKRTRVVFSKLKELNFVSDRVPTWSEEEWKSWFDSLKQENISRLKRSVFKSEKRPSGHLNSFERLVFVVAVENLVRKLKEQYVGYDISVKSTWGNIENPAKRFSYYSKIERSLKRAIESESHQVGSTLKPIFYQYFTEGGRNVDEMVSVKPLTLKLKSGDWSPREAHKNLPDEVSIREALLHSYNRPVINLAEEYGWEKLEEKLSFLKPELKTPLKEYPAQLLGAIELSLAKLFDVYRQFFVNQCEKEVQGKITMILSDPKYTTIRKRVSKLLSQMRFFGKTGTSNNGLDNWFISFDGKELGVTWVGVESSRDKAKKLKLYGSNTSFELFQFFSSYRGRQFKESLCLQAK
jgi:penicillin-binding protein 1B